MALLGVVENVKRRRWRSARYAVNGGWKRVTEVALEQKEVVVDAGEDLTGWENVVLDGVSLPGARGCVEVCGIGIGFWEKTCLCST